MEVEYHLSVSEVLLPSSAGKESVCSAGDPGSIPGSGRSPGGGNGYPLQYSRLENFTDKGAWRAAVHGVAKSWARLTDFTSSWVMAVDSHLGSTTASTQAHQRLQIVMRFCVILYPWNFELFKWLGRF